MFIGRQRELRFLREAIAGPGSAMIPIYGRRRVGKSELILQFLAQHPGIYYVGKTAPAQLQANEFCREAARALDDTLVAGLSTQDWRTILLEVTKRWKSDHKLVLVLDEFQWMVQASPELPSVLQELWDRYWSRGRPSLMLILCGSFVGFMEREILGKKSPLFGRRTGQIQLGPFDHIEAAGFHPRWSLEDKARAYFLCGGIPWYLLQLDGAQSLEHNIAHTVLSELSPLYREPEFLLREELREVESYYAVLLAIAQGAARPTEIAQRSGIGPASLTYYLQQLVELGYVERRFPLTGRVPVRRHVRYRVSDPLLAFWFRFVFPNLSYIQQVGGNRAWREQIRHDIDGYWGLCFERLCRKAVPRLYQRFGFSAACQVGEYWSKDVQIDLIIRRDDHQVDFGECKWGTVRSMPALLTALSNKVSHYPHLDGASAGHLLFLRKLPHQAKAPTGASARWIDLNELYSD